MFRFDDNVRPTVEQLVAIMEWANMQDSDEKLANDGHSIYASQRNVFGHAFNGMMAIIEEECGKKVADYASREFNWGGGKTWLDDCELAVQCALDRVEIENQRDKKPTLEVGKKYLNRIGDSIEIVSYKSDTSHPFMGSDGNRYTENGSFYDDEYYSTQDLTNNEVE